MGKLIEFYHPAPKPPAQAVPEVVEPAIAPADLLRELLAKSETIFDLVVLMRDRDGQIGLVSNLDGPGENIMFMEQVKHEWFTRMRADVPPPKGTA